MDFVINEWFPEYLRPAEARGNSELNHRLAQDFLYNFEQKNDLLLVRNGSPFVSKILKYSDDFGDYPKSRKLFKRFIATVLKDSERCRQIYDSDLIEFSATTKRLLELDVAEIQRKHNFYSDTYLFEAAQHAESKIIVTTDKRLQEHMKDDAGFEVCLLEVFLEKYYRIEKLH